MHIPKYYAGEQLGYSEYTLCCWWCWWWEPFGPAASAKLLDHFVMQKLHSISLCQIFHNILLSCIWRQTWLRHNFISFKSTHLSKVLNRFNSRLNLFPRNWINSTHKSSDFHRKWFETTHNNSCTLLVKWINSAHDSNISPWNWLNSTHDQSGFLKYWF